jgi:hypothetical protein
MNARTIQKGYKRITVICLISALEQRPLPWVCLGYRRQKPYSESAFLTYFFGLQSKNRKEIIE